MNKLKHEAAKKVLDTSQESCASGNEESDSVTDQSSSMSENAARNHKNGKSSKPAAVITSTATQFSVQRSDADGLRMKISAIRPNNNVSATNKSTEANKEQNTKSKPPEICDKVSARTDNIKDKINNKLPKQQQKGQKLQKDNKKPLETMAADAVAGSRGKRNNVGTGINEANITDSGGPAKMEKSDKINCSVGTENANCSSVVHPFSLAAPTPCLSDATESGLSEATTTTIAAGHEKAAKKIKVKRKKAQNKANETKKLSKKSRPQAAFSSDSENEPLVLKQQRAPRILLTAINTKPNVPQPKMLNSLSSAVTQLIGSDNIGISSSDNELPNLVSAAIKRVESDTDDTAASVGFRKAKSKNLQQYQSTLLQDYVEKTQMFGQTPARITSPQNSTKSSRHDLIANVNANSPSDSLASSSGLSKKRRGRPKKEAAVEMKNTSVNPVAVSTINESADSGVISSTTQSISPSPKMPFTKATTPSATSPVRQQQEIRTNELGSATSSPMKSSSDNTAVLSMSSKPKIDIAYLDKRIYATERVLYPPPRNKRRQSMSTSCAQKTSQKDKSATTLKTPKEELQLDPVWRKIDVNKKFRRPSVSGYKSDGGGGNTTICSKILAAKSGYVSDYGSVHSRSHRHHASGYKSDASCKSRYSTKSCVSRRSRAKSCGYRSDCKESGATLKSTKFRRKRRCTLMKSHSKSVGNLNDEQDILQLAGLSLGQSSEESNEYVCKPNLESLPTTSASKKYGEINRYIATGEYFGRGSSGGSKTFSSLCSKRAYDTTNEDGSQDGYANSCSGKLLLQRKNSIGSELTHDILLHAANKIKSRRSSAASYCSSYYSGTSKIRRRRRRKSFRFPSSGKSSIIDSKLLTEIEIIINQFPLYCRIQGNEKSANNFQSGKEKLLADAIKFQGTIGSGSSSSKRDREKRGIKKRKTGESIDFSLLSVNSGSMTPLSGSTKRRHKKACSSSPDDHKLPLKKRHYLLTPGEKSSEAVAAKIFAGNVEAWAAAAGGKTPSFTKLQQQSSSKSSKAGVTPKKRHLLQNAQQIEDASSGKGSNSSPLRVLVDSTSISGGKLLDISPLSLNSLKQNSEPAQKKRSRPESVVAKGSNLSDESVKEVSKNSLKSISNTPQLDSETSCPPPGVFEPSVELEIQIPPITKLTEAAASIITKSEVDSPLLMELNKPFVATSTKVESNRVIETLLNKTGGNLVLKRKRKKINRTGFPTVRRKKRKITENLLLDITPYVKEQVDDVNMSAKENQINEIKVQKKSPTISATLTNMSDKNCDRVPQAGEASDVYIERAGRAPRLSVVALERLQSTPIPKPEKSDRTPADQKRRKRKKENHQVEKDKDKQVERVQLQTREQTEQQEHHLVKKPKISKSRKLAEEQQERQKQEQKQESIPSPKITKRKKKFSKIENLSKEIQQQQKQELQQSETSKTPNRKEKITKSEKLLEENNQQQEQQMIQIPKTSKRKEQPTKKQQQLLQDKILQQLLKKPKSKKLKEKPMKTEKIPADLSPPSSANKKHEIIPIDKKEKMFTVPAEIRKRGRKSKTNIVEEMKRIPTEKTKADKTTDVTGPLSKKRTKVADKPPLSKSSVQKIITAKSLENKVKLPAGIDPNTNFSCKIRLKRRRTLNASAIRISSPVPKVMTPVEEIRSIEEIEVEAAAKDSQTLIDEHDALPQNDISGIDFETASDTSDEKSPTASMIAIRRLTRFKKNYLTAGLFSDHFKIMENPNLKPLTNNKKGDKQEELNGTISETSSTSMSLLPPPPYCEKYFRRTQIDFVLPYDIWWAYTNAKLPTRITVPSWNYRKLRTNIYAESVRPNLAGFDHPTCNCKVDVGCGDNCLNRMVYTECSPSSCPTREKCRNQKIQRHEVAPGVERFMTLDKGWGVRTKLPIEKGTYILEYVGEVVTEREFKDRMGTIYLDDIHHYCLHLDGGLVIDGHRMGSDGRFVNHSCEPNCEMQKWSVNGLSRMALFAKRNIEASEELCYDYNFALFNPSEGQPCRCGTSQCRGVIGGKSQRIKPLPAEFKSVETPLKDGQIARQRKQKARKNTQRLCSREIVYTRGQQLTEKEKKFVKQFNIFLVRNFEKVRRCKTKQKLKKSVSKSNTPTSVSPTASPATITNRRPSTPNPVAAQISVLCAQRNVKTRGFTLAAQDPEVEKMAKVAVALRDICSALEEIKNPNDVKTNLISVALCATAINKKKKQSKTILKQEAIDFKSVQANIEQGHYKQPNEFDDDMQRIFADAKQAHAESAEKLKALTELTQAYDVKKLETYKQLLELIGDETALVNFSTKQVEVDKNENENKNKTENENEQEKEKENKTENENENENEKEKEKITDNSIGFRQSRTQAEVQPSNAVAMNKIVTNGSVEDIIQCICGLYKDEGVMIQCARCMVWQHTECTKADINADNYLCELCEPRIVDREIPLEDFTEDGHRYYLSLMRGDLHVRQGDAVYVLRDIPIKDEVGHDVPSKKHTYETIGNIDYNECDIFRVERLWKNEEGKRFIFGHHFLRPHETFHEPSRRFYPNEVVRVPLYEVVPIELVIGRCWVLDRTTFCKGRPIECKEEEHCYICELRVDKSARFFSKAKVNYPTCTKSYAFQKFQEKLKIAKTYAPHEIDPAMLKGKKQQRIENESESSTPLAQTASTSKSKKKHDLQKTSQLRNNYCNNGTDPIKSNFKLLTEQDRELRQTRLETVLKDIKSKQKSKVHTSNELSKEAIDISYLFNGHLANAKKRKTNTKTASSKTVIVPTV